MNRSAVFLDEMGVGPLWRLRQGAAPAVAETAVAEAPLDMAEPVAMVELAEEVKEIVVQLAAEPVAVAAPVQPVEVAGDDSNAWFDDAPPPPPVKQVTDAEIAAMDWAALASAVSKCARCALCKTRKGVVMGRGDRQGDWMLVASSPSRGEEREGRALGGEQGRLLDNMLKAIDLDAEKNVYITHLLKCRPLDDAGQERLPSESEAAACRPYFERERELLQPRTIVTLGQMAAAGILPGEKPVRGKVRQLGEAAVLATFHPDMLLRDETGQAKARAWADLCLATSTHAARN
ncbi:uracil-DNA glycosylase [Janthinobacterium sp.]|uniref:uracil-DNA glycosylase n=1 Tax=Janthinobacterium sp. TaxID=1871054 RepID=UPI00289C70EC|nr:uracil-DNA glycosylase [Janthinobacterium sp.]